jgi:hypothetical protein
MLHKLIILMVEKAVISDTSVNIYQTTRRNKPEDSRLENLKSHRL